MRIAVANAGICLSKGGSERAAIRLAQEMRQRGHEVHLLTVLGAFSPLYPIDPLIPVHFFPKSFFSPQISAVKSGPALLGHYGIDILVSFESDWKHKLWQYCSSGANVPFVCSERMTPWLIEHKFWNPQGRASLFNSCAAIHELLPCYLPMVPPEYRHKVFVIPNSAPENIPATCPHHDEEPPVLLYLGRFGSQKRPELLLKAFAILAPEFPQWLLRFAGWGEEEQNLRDLSATLKLDDRVEIRAAEADVAKEYEKASVYCLPTRHEGFPNTVLEAMGAGLPVAAVADCPAMTSIIKPGITGVLAERPTPEALAQALRPLLSSAEVRLRMGRNAWEECSGVYSSRRIFDQWEQHLQRIISENK